MNYFYLSIIYESRNKKYECEKRIRLVVGDRVFRAVSEYKFASRLKYVLPLIVSFADLLLRDFYARLMKDEFRFAQNYALNFTDDARINKNYARFLIADARNFIDYTRNFADDARETDVDARFFVADARNLVDCARFYDVDAREKESGVNIIKPGNKLSIEYCEILNNYRVFTAFEMKHSE